MSLFKDMYWACKAAEDEFRHNEKLLQMQLDVANKEREEIIKLLSTKGITDSEICNRLRLYYDITGKTVPVVGS